MARHFAKKFYNSNEWKKVRKEFIAWKFGICERCGKPNSKQVHHIIYITFENINDPEITLDFKNLELLCDTCHQKEHHEKYLPTVWGLDFDKNGDLIKIIEKQDDH